jgi:hypothetical protein
MANGERQKNQEIVFNIILQNLAKPNLRNFGELSAFKMSLNLINIWMVTEIYFLLDMTTDNEILKSEF